MFLGKLKLTAMDDMRLTHELKVVQTMQRLQGQGWKVDRVTEPSTVDIVAWGKLGIHFIEVKAGKEKELTPNEKEIKKLIESNPKLTYEVV